MSKKNEIKKLQKNLKKIKNDSGKVYKTNIRKR